MSGTITESTETTPVIVRGSTQRIAIYVPSGALTTADTVEVWLMDGKNGKSIVKTNTHATNDPSDPYSKIKVDESSGIISLALSENETLMLTQSPCYIQVRMICPVRSDGPYEMPPVVVVTKILKLAVEPSLWDEPIRDETNITIQ